MFYIIFTVIIFFHIYNTFEFCDYIRKFFKDFADAFAIFNSLADEKVGRCKAERVA